jgi:hypothetical protein
MTLVAAYREYSVPILLGDLLISIGQAPSQSGKKVHRIAPTLAVGWTGVQIAAARALADLRDRFSQERPTRERLQTALRALGPDIAPLALKLAGWIVEEDAHCFLWDSGHPERVSYAERHVEGSGAAQFLAAERIDVGQHDASEVVQTALAAACELLADEIGPRLFQSQYSFGYAYEVLFLDRGAFRYASNVLFAFADLRFDSDERYVGPELAQPPVFYHYDHVDDHAVVTKLTAAGSLNHIVRDIVPPAYSVGRDRALELARRLNPPPYLPIRPDYSCLFARINGDAHRPMVAVGAAASSKTIFRATLEIRDSLSGACEWVLQFPPERWLESYYREWMASRSC